MSLSDRELLELAAKAAGIRLEWDGHPDQWQPMYYEGKTYLAWEPFDDDGDALRLAAACGMIVDLRYTKPEIAEYNRVEYWLKGAPENVLFFRLGVHHDPQEALRRCIVRAAAVIGKAMPAPT